MGEHSFDNLFENVNTDITPRLFTPSIIHRTFNLNNGFTLPILKSIIVSQQQQIDTLNNTINEHEKEIQILKTSLSEIRDLLHEKHRITRSTSFHENDSCDPIHTTN